MPKMSTEVVQSLSFPPPPPLSLAIRAAAAATASLFFLSSCSCAGESALGGPWSEESRHIWAHPLRRPPVRHAARLTNRGAPALAPLVMPAKAVLATWGLGSDLGSGARGAREQVSTRLVEDEEAMAARGGGAVECGGPVGEKPARRADRRGWPWERIWRRFDPLDDTSTVNKAPWVDSGVDYTTQLTRERHEPFRIYTK
jgi:hypothetical protein